MAFKVRELYNELGEVVEIIGDIMGGKVIEESENEYQIYCPTSFYHLPELNINIHYADLMTYEEDTEDYMVTDNIFLVFDRDKKRFFRLLCKNGDNPYINRIDKKAARH